MKITNISGMKITSISGMKITSISGMSCIIHMKIICTKILTYEAMFAVVPLCVSPMVKTDSGAIAKVIVQMNFEWKREGSKDCR